MANNVEVLTSPFAVWRFSQLGNGSVPADTDLEGDGLSILEEYALVLSPLVPNPMPAAHLYGDGDGRRLRVLFNRDPAHSDVTIEVQATADISGPWSTIAASTMGGITTGPGYVTGDGPGGGIKTVEVRDVVDIGSASRRFLRLQIKQ
jgi:hypothetical protein